jgi:hypothetical protein
MRENRASGLARGGWKQGMIATAPAPYSTGHLGRFDNDSVADFLALDLKAKAKKGKFLPNHFWLEHIYH